MNLKYTMRSAAVLFAAVMVTGFAILFFTPQTSAQTTQTTTSVTASSTQTFRAQIDSLSVALTAIGDAIASSTTLTASERLTLFTQLVELSRAIITLQRIDATTSGGSVVNNQAVVTNEVLPEDIGLHQIDVQLNLNTFEAVMVEYYLDADDDVVNEPFNADFIRTTTTVQLTQPSVPGFNFEDTVFHAEEQIVKIVQQNTGITDDLKIYRLTHMSARNPLRDQPITTNSAAGFELSGQFGKQTNVTKVTVKPGDNIGQVELISDQGETMVVEVVRMPGTLLTSYQDEYVLNRYYYAPSVLNVVSLLSQALVASETSGNLTEDEVLQALRELMDFVPFTRNLRNPDKDLLDYMLLNTGEYVVDSNTTLQYRDTVVRDCVDDADRKVLNDYALQLLSGLQVNYILSKTLVEYEYPLLIQDNVTFEGCRSQAQYF